jgi:hypothetical protein
MRSIFPPCWQWPWQISQGKSPSIDDAASTGLPIGDRVVCTVFGFRHKPQVMAELRRKGSGWALVLTRRAVFVLRLFRGKKISVIFDNWRRAYGWAGDTLY